MGRLNVFWLVMTAVFIGLLSVPRADGAGDTPGPEGIRGLSLADLLDMEVTTVSKHAERVSDAPGVVSVVTRDELERFGGTTLRDVLERVPGLISAGANYTNRTTIAVRGDQIKQNSSHVLILINGRPVREVQEGGVSSDLLEAFPVNVVDKIEVVKGPGSVLYGSDAFSGVINIITKTAETNGISVTGLGSGGGGGAFGHATLRRGDLSVTAAGRYLSKTEWDADYKATGMTGTGDTSVTLHIPNEGSGAYVEASYGGLRFMSSYTDWRTIYISGIQNDIVELDRLFANTGYSLTVRDRWDMDYNVTYTRSRLQGTGISERDCYNLVVEMTHTIAPVDKMRLTFGGLYNKNDGREKSLIDAGPMLPIPVGAVISQGDVNSLALYAQLDYQVLEFLTLVGGLQANKVENITLDVVPQAGVIAYPLPNISVKLLYSEAFRAPSINEINMDFSGIISGNPGLRPEDVATVDLNVGYTGERGHASMSLFVSKMTDIVQLDDANTYQNQRNVLFMGGECDGKWYVTPDLFVTGSVLYQTNEEDTMVNMAPVANMGIKAGISYASDRGMTVGLFDIYQGDLDGKFIGDLNPHQGAYNLLHLHSAFELNALLHLPAKPAVSLVINVDNLLNEEHFGYDLGGRTSDGIPQIPGRTIYVGVKAGL